MNTKQIFCFTFLCCLFLGSALPSIAQKTTDKGWYIGVTAQPFKYWRYNKSEWNYIDKGRFQVNNKKVMNGWAAGISVAKLLSEKWGIHSGLNYSSQTQKYLNSGVEKLNKDGTSQYIIGGKTDANFKYTSLPITALYQIYFGRTRKNVLVIEQGLNVSYLSNYRIFTEIYDPLNGDWIVTYDVTKNYFTSKSPSGNDNARIDNWLSQKWILGSITSIKIRNSWGKKSNLHSSFGFFLNYDFTNQNNADSFHSQFLTGDYLTVKSADKVYKTHNIRLGLEFGLQYYFQRKPKEKAVESLK
jgi:hypothetical protein